MPVRFWRITGENGCYWPAEKLIIIRKGMGQAQTIKTLVHEIAHAKLLGRDGERLLEESLENRASWEIHAECVAYLVCRRLGINTFSFSFAYMEHWIRGKKFEEVTAFLDAAICTVNEITNEMKKLTAGKRS